MSFIKKIFHQNVLVWLGIVAATFALAVFMFLGVFTRLLADDYCLSINVHSGNIFLASWDKYLTSSNRFSNLFVVGVGELFGPRNVAYAPALLIALWVAGLTWLGVELKKMFHWSVASPALLLGAEIAAALTLYQLPNLFQSIYWRPGQVSYFTPIVLFTFLFAGLTRAVRVFVQNGATVSSGKNVEKRQLGNRSIFWLAPLFTFCAFFIGGLSETIGAFHIAALTLAIVFVARFEKSPRRVPALTLLIALLIGALIALIAMYFAPANALRLKGNDAERDLFFLMDRVWNYGLSFNADAWMTRPLPALMSIALGFLLTFMFYNDETQIKSSSFPRAPRYWLALILIPVLEQILVFAIVSPSAYGQSYPVERVRLPAFYVFTLALMSLGVCLARMAKQIRLPNFARPLAFVSLFVALSYPIWIGAQASRLAPDMREWSSRWDARERMVYRLVAQGETKLALPRMPGYFGTKELDAREYYWVNRCAAQYYGVDSLFTFTATDEYYEELLKK